MLKYFYSITILSFFFSALCGQRPIQDSVQLSWNHKIFNIWFVASNFGILRLNTELKVFVFEVKYFKVNHYYYHYYLVPKWLTVLYNYLSYGWFGCYFSPSVDDSSKQFFKTARCFLNCCIIYLKFRLVVWSKFVNCLHVSLNLINRS